jgi:transforming growth factor-beta-induced protein
MTRQRTLLGRTLLAPVLLVLLLASCGTPPSPTPPTAATLAEVVAADPDLSTLVTALETAGLLEVLDDPDLQFTVFAPTNAAFAALLETFDITAEQLLTSPGLADLLTYHVVADMALGAAALIETSPGRVTTVEGSDVTYLVVNGDVRLNGTATVTSPDIEASNGVLHKLDAVLLPDSEPEPGTLTAVVDEDEALSTLAAALAATGLDATLADPDAQFTLFAPTDAAFAALLVDLDITLDELLGSPALADILAYHVLVDVVLDAELMFDTAPSSVTTAEGSELTYDILDGEAVLGEMAVVLEADIEARNGVLHKIDAVLTPPAP